MRSLACSCVCLSHTHPHLSYRGWASGVGCRWVPSSHPSTLPHIPSSRHCNLSSHRGLHPSKAEEPNHQGGSCPRRKNVITTCPELLCGPELLHAPKLFHAPSFSNAPSFSTPQVPPWSPPLCKACEVICVTLTVTQDVDPVITLSS